MRRLCLVGMSLWLVAVSAWGLTPARRAVLLGSFPSWVMTAGGVIASVDCNFSTGQYWASGQVQPSCPLTITRASQETNLLPSSASGASALTFANNVAAITPGSGLAVWESRTNQLFNSTVPATQTTGALGTGTYTLWVNGPGSATMSAGTGTGCGTGVATNGTAVNFTITIAGTCTVTVTGILAAFQLESGAFGSPLIVTGGATGTRAADNINAAGALLTALNGATSIAIMGKALWTPTASGQIMEGAGGGGGLSFGANAVPNRPRPIVRQSATASARGDFNTGAGPILTTGSVSSFGLSFDSINPPLASNGGTALAITTNPAQNTWQTPIYVGSRGATSLFWDQYIQRIVVIPQAIGQTALNTAVSNL